MDDKGRLRVKMPSGSEFVGQSYDETGVGNEGENRRERRKRAAEQRRSGAVPATVNGSQVNAVLQAVRAMVPGDTPEHGDAQLTILSIALSVAARSCGVSRAVLLARLGENFDDVVRRRLTTPLKLGGAE